MKSYKRQTFHPTALPATVRAKWDDAVLEEGFVPFPKKLLRTMHQFFDGAEVAELSVILAVVDFRRPSQERQPSPDYLADLAGLSREDFDEALERLVAKKLATVVQHSEGIEVKLKGLTDAVCAATTLQEFSATQGKPGD